uniref:Uncharacterized protein n=1 Tax=Chenopodium quinoa TaxID=63459 RepID=A0A803MMC3_CHEQI
MLSAIRMMMPMLNGNGSCGGGDNGNGGGGVDGLNDVTIYRYSEINQPLDYISTYIVANNYSSWTTFAGAIFAIWVYLHNIPNERWWSRK